MSGGSVPRIRNPNSAIRDEFRGAEEFLRGVDGALGIGGAADGDGGFDGDTVATEAVAAVGAAGVGRSSFDLQADPIPGARHDNWLLASA